MSAAVLTRTGIHKNENVKSLDMWFSQHNGITKSEDLLRLVVFQTKTKFNNSLQEGYSMQKYCSILKRDYYLKIAIY